jgi:hypothetical protein
MTEVRAAVSTRTNPGRGDAASNACFDRFNQCAPVEMHLAVGIRPEAIAGSGAS